MDASRVSILIRCVAGGSHGKSVAVTGGRRVTRENYNEESERYFHRYGKHFDDIRAAHGTYKRSAHRIFDTGFSDPRATETREDNMFGMRMPAECSERVSGVRANREIWFFVYLRDLVEHGYAFYLSPNGVMSVPDPIPVTMLTAVDMNYGTYFEPWHGGRRHAHAEGIFQEIVQMERLRKY